MRVEGFRVWGIRSVFLGSTRLVVPCTLRVQIPNNHILSQIVTYITTDPKPKYLIIGSFGPLGCKVYQLVYTLCRYLSVGSSPLFVK